MLRLCVASGLSSLLILNGVGRNHDSAFHVGNSFAVYASKPMWRARLQNEYVPSGNLPSKSTDYAMLCADDVRVAGFC